MRTILIALIILMVASSPALAKLKSIGNGDAMRLDPSQIPPQMNNHYEIFKVKCIKCHTLERTIVAIKTGIAPISNQPFDRTAVKAYGIKMLRKPDSNMNKADVKATVDLMNYLLDVAAK